MKTQSGPTETEPKSLLARITFIARNYFGQMNFRRDAGPIDTLAEVERYAATRSAFVTQKKLYGYLKTRMGTQYSKVFADDVFVRSISIANHRIYPAALSDLTIFCVAQALDGHPSAKAEDREGIALECFRNGLAANREGRPEPVDEEGLAAEFAARLAETDWHGRALKAENFTLSPRALVRWAPIAPELKKYDAEIVANSMKYAWLDIRARYLKRLRREAVWADIAANSEN